MEKYFKRYQRRCHKCDDIYKTQFRRSKICSKCDARGKNPSSYADKIINGQVIKNAKLD